MNENTITIPLEEYKELLRGSEKIKVVERLLQSNEYVCVAEIIAVLNIEKGETK